ncbi:MAG: TldD/PmbA family protein [Oscillospiraceae bacterium]|jgi:PmbA protein|nr:TldD/PmbA family protein [Oscillospiraceae bacterium]
MNNELRKISEFALDALKKQGADGAEVTLSKGRTDELNVDAGEFSLMRTTFNSSLSIRALVGGRKGTATYNSLDDDTVEKAVAAAISSAKSSEVDDAEYIAENIGEHSFEFGAGDCELDKLYDRIGEYMETVKSEYPLVDIMQLVTQYQVSEDYYANSNGTRISSKDAAYVFDVGFSARDGDKTSSMSGYGFLTENLDKSFMENAEMRRMHREMEKQLDTVSVQGKFVGKLLVSPDCLSSFISSVFGNCVSDGSLIAGDSPWKDKLGEVVADPRLSITLDPLNPEIIGRARYTSDGHIVEKQDIIKDGELVGFRLAQYGAKKTGLKRAGNYSGCYIMAPGDKSYDELLAGIGDGLLINRFSGGSPSTNGDFSGVAKNSFLIKDGKVTDAVSETMISGNLLDMLKSVVGISRELITDGSKVLPWIVFDGVTISGK